MPDENAREQILRAITKNTKLHEVDYREIAKITPGYVGADLEALVKEVAAL